MSLFDSIASLAGKAIGTAIGGPIGGLIGDKIASLVSDVVSKFVSVAKDAVSQSTLPDAAKGIVDFAYDAGFKD